ncbi:MAG: Ribosome hibernation promotion factor [candidate division WS2 bacterium]|uniref:Ribosome hibernation promoting factor n=1 Tax=Psychracetigena formicireducens TaxID=2986056 RepID=A0A9E2F0N7_PSYF1|nr:Ribosome hibernation promotion factor [Candidatus Psychracetigena formicireducens]MBT9144569.1 Ribosome hibernation promotion factor [Candidatus Psychracetigena formicireducens]MBT9150577.1 Ribosome hibernation promotion factor [Candidatus Psychracetigena formicireducens]
MNITVKGKNIDLTDDLKEYGTKKINKLTRYFSNIQSVTLTLSLERGQSISEITLLASGKIIRSEERNTDMYSSIDLSVESIENQIRRYKERLTSRSHPNDIIRGISEFQANPEEEREKPKIVKTKKFPLRPMDENEAIEQMELLGHSFFLFIHPQTGNIGLLYKRTDGDLGLILGEL